MSFKGLNFSTIDINPGESLFVSFGLESGFRLLEQKVDNNAVYYRDITDSDPDGISDTPITTSCICFDSRLFSYDGPFSSLINYSGSLLRVGK